MLKFDPTSCLVKAPANPTNSNFQAGRRFVSFNQSSMAAPCFFQALHWPALQARLHGMRLACTNSPIENHAALTVSHVGVGHPEQESVIDRSAHKLVSAVLNSRTAVNL